MASQPDPTTPRRLFIGVDGGQSSTLTVLADEHGTLLASALTGPCNHIHEPGGLERQYRTLRAGYEEVLARAGESLRRVDSVYLGLTGSGHPETVRRVYDTERLVLNKDTVIALAGALPEMVGVIVIAGTGSTAYGRNSAGVEVTVGGHGYYAGDEGSASDIARHAFRAVFRAADGRGPETMLTLLLFEQYGSTTLRGLRDTIYGAEMTRDQLARAAETVGVAALQGDTVARDILRDAGRELGWQVSTALRRLDLLAGPVAVATIGGVFRAGPFVKQPLEESVWQVNPKARFVPPVFVPALGAVILALREGGVEVTPAVLKRLALTQGGAGIGASGQKFD
ncbi:MAG: hypothetical protein JXN59_17650 [Anaerolineae bacterium]|nr:hypothetical protein [Anaerolineae bacterium]